MLLVLQRVKHARVDVEGKEEAAIGQGFMILAGFGADDDQVLPGTSIWRKLVGKIPDLRVFPDADDKLNLSLRDVQGEILVVSQFTLYADCRKGKRPSFHQAADPETARALFDTLVADLSALCPGRVKSGVFAATMDVSLCNAGPVTILLDADDFA